MKLLFVWLINTIIVLPFKVIRLVIKIIYQIIKNIYFNNLNLDYINNLDGYQFEAFTKILLEEMNPASSFLTISSLPSIK